MVRRVVRILRVLRDRLERVAGKRISRAAVGAWIDSWLVRVLERRIYGRIRLVEERELQATFQGALDLLMHRSDRNDIGHYLEFGVYNGTSLLCMYRALREAELKDVRLIGFDSFEGLPADVEGAWRVGDFKSTFGFTQAVLGLSGVDWSRVALVKGWFKDTLNADTVRDYGIDKVGVVMIDCDLYTAAREALDFCHPLIKDEAIIVFDDWHSRGLDEKGMGEKRAFDEFLAANPQFSSVYLESLSEYSDRAAVFLLTRADVEPRAAGDVPLARYER